MRPEPKDAADEPADEFGVPGVDEEGEAGEEEGEPEDEGGFEADIRAQEELGGAQDSGQAEEAEAREDAAVGVDPEQKEGRQGQGKEWAVGMGAAQEADFGGEEKGGEDLRAGREAVGDFDDGESRQGPGNVARRPGESDAARAQSEAKGGKADDDFEEEDAAAATEVLGGAEEEFSEAFVVGPREAFSRPGVEFGFGDGAGLQHVLAEGDVAPEVGVGRVFGELEDGQEQDQAAKGDFDERAHGSGLVGFRGRGGRQFFEELNAEAGVLERFVAEHPDGFVMLPKPAQEFAAETVFLAERFDAVFLGVAVDEHDVVRPVTLEGVGHGGLAEEFGFGGVPNEIARGVSAAREIIEHDPFGQHGEGGVGGSVGLQPRERGLKSRGGGIDFRVESDDAVAALADGKCPALVMEDGLGKQEAEADDEREPNGRAKELALDAVASFEVIGEQPEQQVDGADECRHGQDKAVVPDATEEAELGEQRESEDGPKQREHGRFLKAESAPAQSEQETGDQAQERKRTAAVGPIEAAGQSEQWRDKQKRDDAAGWFFMKQRGIEDH